MLERILGREAAAALTIRGNVLRLVGLIEEDAAGQARPGATSEAEWAAAITARITRLLGL